jgi:hypothetical protein
MELTGSSSSPTPEPAESKTHCSVSAQHLPVFWSIAKCGLEEGDRCFRGAYSLNQGDLIMEAVCTSETSVCFYESTRQYIQEGCHLHTRHSANLKSHIYQVIPHQCYNFSTQITAVTIMILCPHPHHNPKGLDTSVIF